jgi:hypothetical protein
VVAGRPTTLDFDAQQGKIELTVEIKPLPQAKIDMAVVYVVAGAITRKTNGQMRDLMLQGGTASGAYQVWLGQAMPPPVLHVSDGPHTICSAPITGDVQDQNFMARIFKGTEGDQLDVYCVPYNVKPDPLTQTFVHELPSMKPLPPPT